MCCLLVVMAHCLQMSRVLCYRSTHLRDQPNSRHATYGKMQWRIMSTDGAEVSLQQLMSDLDRAIDDEQYELAASLRDEIQKKRQDNRIAVEEANDHFYDAFRNGNYAAMSKIWGNGEQVQCIHPAAECIAGREDVMTSWKLILSSGRMNITLEDVRIYATDTQGYVTLVEVVDAEDSQGRIIATNIFERQQGSWKIVHHHGGPVPNRPLS